MARGLRLDAVALLSVADRPRRWCRWFAIRGARRKRELSSAVRVPRRAAGPSFYSYLSYTITYELPRAGRRARDPPP